MPGGRADRRRIAARLVRPGAGLLVLAFALAGCSSGQPAASGSSAGSTGPTASSSAAAATSGASGPATSETSAPATTSASAAPSGSIAPDTVPPTDFSTNQLVVTRPETGQLVSVTSGTSNGVDELTFTFDSATTLPGYSVAPVQAVTAGPNGDVVELAGTAALAVNFTLTTPGPPGPMSTAIPDNAELGLPIALQIVLVYNVAGDLRFGVGLAVDAAFKVQTLTNPARLVVDLRPA